MPLVVIISDALKLFHSGNALLYEADASLLQSYHSLVCNGILLHFFCRGISCYHLTHLFIYYENFMDSRTA